MATPQRAMSKWARRSRKTAALLAAWARTSGNSALTALATSAKRSRCSSKYSDSRFVGSREVGPDAGQLEVGVGGAGAGQLENLRWVGVPSRPMPLSCLT